MRKLAIIDKNPNAAHSQWRAAADPKKFFHDDRSLVGDIKKYNPDFIFINKANTFTNIAAAIMGHKSLYFYGDYYRPMPQYVKGYGSMCDAVILTNKDKSFWSQIQNKNIFFVSQGVDTNVFKPICVRKKYDIIFGANYYGPKFCGSDMRLSFVRYIDSLGYNFWVVGDGWPKGIKAIPRQGLNEYNRIINQARITVGMSHFVDVPFYTSNRIYQCMATGVPHICWNAPGVGSLFETGYCGVNSYAELSNTINLYMNDEKKRKKLGIFQALETISNHTIFHSWSKIEAIMEGLDGN